MEGWIVDGVMCIEYRTSAVTKDGFNGLSAVVVEMWHLSRHPIVPEEGERRRMQDAGSTMRDTHMIIIVIAYAIVKCS